MNINSQNHNRNIAFKGFTHNPFIRKLQNISKLPCPCCGKPMIPIDLVNNNRDFFINEPRNAINSLIRSYPDSLTRTQLNILKFLSAATKDTSGVDIADICAYNYPGAKAVVKSMEKKVYENWLRLHTDLSEIPKMKFKKLLLEISQDPQFDKNFLKGSHQLFSLWKKESFPYFTKKDIEIKNKIFNCFKELPNTYTSSFAFVYDMHNKGYCSPKIFHELLTPSMASIEHIKPKYFNGSDKTVNLFPECTYCNKKHSSMPWPEFLRDNIEMVSNIKDTFMKIIQLIKKGELKQNYYRYLTKVAKTFETETNGIINIDVDRLYVRGQIDKLENYNNVKDFFHQKTRAKQTKKTDFERSL